MRRRNSKKQNVELDSIAMEHGGILRASDVVEFARNPDTALHKKFEWDDTKAAERYRINQASHIIKCHVTYIPAEQSEPVKVRGYISLPSMRGNQEYRNTEDILDNDDWRCEMLDMALKELKSFRQKYEVLSELASTWEKVDQIKDDITKKKHELRIRMDERAAARTVSTPASP